MGILLWASSGWKWSKRAYRKTVSPVMKWFALRITQLFLILLAVIVGYYHAYPTAVHSDKTDFPVIDAVTLGCVGIIIIAIMLPVISEVTLGAHR